MQQDAINATIKRKNEEKSVPLEHALILVKSLLQQKSVNMELTAQIGEIKAQVEQSGHSIPFFSG